MIDKIKELMDWSATIVNFLTAIIALITISKNNKGD